MARRLVDRYCSPGPGKHISYMKRKTTRFSGSRGSYQAASRRINNLWQYSRGHGAAPGPVRVHN
eukprot:2288844-Prymnesium_polylepis.1